MNPQYNSWYAHLHGFSCILSITTSDLFVTGGSDGRILIHSTSQLEENNEPSQFMNASPIKAIEYFTDGITSISTDGKSYLVCSCEDGSIISISLLTFKYSENLFKFAVPARQVSFHPHGLWVAAIKIYLSSLSEERIVLKGIGHESMIKCISFHPTGKVLASLDSAGSLRLWDVTFDTLASCTRYINVTDTTAPPSIFTGLSSEYRGLLVDPFERIFMSWRGSVGTALAIPSNDSIQVYSFHDGKLSYSNSLFGGHTKRITFVEWSPCGSCLAAISVDKKLIIWSFSNYQHTKNYTIDLLVNLEEVPTGLCWLPNSSNLIVTDESGSFTYIPFTLKEIAILNNKDEISENLVESSIVRSKRKNLVLDDDEEEEGSCEKKKLDNKVGVSQIKSIISQNISTSNNLIEESTNIDTMASSEENVLSELNYSDDEEFGDYEDNLENRTELQGRKLASSSRYETFCPSLISVLQPGSTPISGRRRFLAWNNIGWISVLLNEDDEELGTIDIGFNDHSFMKPIHFVDYIGYQFGSLSSKGAFFGSKCKSIGQIKEDQSKSASLYYLPFSSWAPKSEWRADLPFPESVTAITCSDEYLIVATDFLYIRIYSAGGFQHTIFSITQPIVCITAESKLLFLMYGRYSSDYAQCISFSIYDLENQRDIPIGNRSLPLSLSDSPSNTLTIRSLSKSGDPVSLTWAGFISPHSIPAFMDSCGIVRALFSEYGWAWVPILDAYQQISKTLPNATTGTKMNIFPISLNEENILIALIKGDDPWPSVFPRSPIKELPISPPSSLGRLDLEAEKRFFTLSLFKKKHLLSSYGLSISVPLAKKRIEETKSDKLVFELLKKAIDGSKLSLALELCSLFQLEKSIDLAIQLASASQLTDLSQRIQTLKLERFSHTVAQSVLSAENQLTNPITQILTRKKIPDLDVASTTSSFMNSILEYQGSIDSQHNSTVPTVQDLGQTNNLIKAAIKYTIWPTKKRNGSTTMQPEKTRKKALIILTNISRLPSKGSEKVHFTGFDAKAVAHLWNLLVVRNFYQIDYCTPEGGHAPLDPRSAEESRNDPIVQAFLQNKSLVETFQETISAKRIIESLPIEYSLVGIVGAHGALIDIATSVYIYKIVTRIYEQGGIICTIGHGLAGVLGASINNSPLLKGRKVTCSTRTEDEFQEVEVPFFLDERLMAIGAWVLNKGPFELNVCIDDNDDTEDGGRIISGQNTESVPAWIELLETKLHG